MNKTAIIPAAGWKAAGQKDGLTGCPECFLPLGNGTTSLSRTAMILADNDFEVYIAIGKLGYPYSKYVRLFATPDPPSIGDDFFWNSSPWTQERYDYAAQYGTVIEIPNPGGWSTSWDTLCIAMDTIGEENWERLLLARGDMIIPRYYLETIINAAYPSVFLFTAFHSYIQLDIDGAKFLRSYVEQFRRFETKESWKHDKNMSPDHWGTQELKKAGFDIHGRDLANNKWTDVDIAATYHDACRLVNSKAYDG